MEKDYSSLKHIVKKLKGGGQVIVVDTGAVLGAEELAMIQALKSRSNKGFFAHILSLIKFGTKVFLNIYYIGFGHKSIGDLGDAIVIVEGVSMLAAKAIQDWPLYNGTEGSTRFMNFSEQVFLNPLGTQEGEDIQKDWRSAYLRGLSWLQGKLRERFPMEEGESEKDYAKAINARACDIMRGFLPAGTVTDLTWKMNLRQFADELVCLRHHPLEEVREIAEITEVGLMEMYPNSFSIKRYPDTENYVSNFMKNNYFFKEEPEKFSAESHMNFTLLNRYREAMMTRPNEKTELPKKINECGTVTFEFLLDFGSFRDIQRHRAVVQQMPLLTTKYGFNDWYLSEIGELAREMKPFIWEQSLRINELRTSDEIRQYYIAMGFNTTNRLTGGLGSLVYLVELRSTHFVHPTLVKAVRQMADFLKKEFGRYGLVLHLDPEPNRFDVKRGTHDIVIKE